MSTFTKSDERSFGGDIAAIGNALAFNTEGCHALSAWVSGTFAGMNCIFEVSFNTTDGVDGTWIPVQATRSNAPTVETSTGALSASPAYFWEIDVAGAHWFRVRCTARTSGAQAWVVIARDSDVDATPNVQVVGTVPVTATPSTPTTYSLNSAANTNLTSVKASAGSVYSLAVSNLGAGAAYLKLYNKASAPVVASDVPVMVIPVPATGFVNVPFGALGKRFSTGIALAVTGAVADTDATAVAAAQVKVSLDYV